jgi:hypothetical protein
LQHGKTVIRRTKKKKKKKKECIILSLCVLYSLW